MPTLEIEIGERIKSGKSLRFGTEEPIEDVKSIGSFEDEVFEEGDCTIRKYFRWSPGKSFSSWWELTQENLNCIPFDEVIDQLKLEFKYDVDGDCEPLVDKFTLEYKKKSEKEEPEKMPCSFYELEDDYCQGITVKSDPNLKPNEAAEKAGGLFSKINKGIANFVGINICYVKVDAVDSSRDDVLKEYSQYRAKSMKEIKAVVPKGELPQNEYQFTPFDMGFMGEGEFELHIPKEFFEVAFGPNANPQKNDVLYIPLMDKIWQVHASILSREEFMYQPSFYKVRLVKYQKKENVVMDSEGNEADEISDLAKDFEEEFSPDEFAQEVERTTKPDQYKAISIGRYDHVRNFMAEDLRIVDQPIENYYTIVAKYAYDLQTVEFGERAVEYKLGVGLEPSKDLMITMWWWYDRKDWSKYPGKDVLLDGDVSNGGSELRVEYDTGVKKPQAFVFEAGSDTFTFDDVPDLSSEKWYALVLNVSNTHGEVALYLWELRWDPDRPDKNQTTDLRMLYHSHDNCEDLSFSSESSWKLLGGTVDITNVRFMEAPIEPEKQPLFLNQYTVDDEHLALLIDNAIPPLRMERQRPI